MPSKTGGKTNKRPESAKPPTSKIVPPKGKSEPSTSEKPKAQLFNRKEGKSLRFHYLLLIQAKFFF